MLKSVLCAKMLVDECFTTCKIKGGRKEGRVRVGGWKRTILRSVKLGEEVTFALVFPVIFLFYLTVY